MTRAILYAVHRWRRTGGRCRRTQRPILVTGLCLALPLLFVTWSFSSYVFVDNGDTIQQRAVTWGRDHHLGGIVDLVERERLSAPPSGRAERDLALNPAAAQGATPAPSTAGTAKASDGGNTTTTGADVGRSLVVGAPSALVPALAPALPAEGTWQVVASAGGAPAVWATSIRPSAAYPSVVASLAEMDQTHLRFGLFNGNEVPGGVGWKRGDHVPVEIQPALVAAFNGGFRFDNEPGGYVTEGRTVRPLLGGQATLAIDRVGRLFVGEYGRDLTNDGTWVSLRQNLPVIVDHGVSQVPLKPGTDWGKNYHNVIFVTRSAVCLRFDGRYAYVAVGPVDAPLLGDVLVSLRCERAIELDINGKWPTFVSFHTAPGGHESADFLDRRMGGSPTRYLTSSSKEFFAAFDPAALPPASALDTP